MAKHRLYGDLSWIWPFLSPPEHYPEESRTISEILQNHHIPKQSPLLHLGSGGGSLDFHLKKDYKITGLDRSPEMIKVAQHVNPDVEYIQADMGNLHLSRIFPAILLHDASAYLTSQNLLLRVFAKVFEHLEPHGVFILLPEVLSEDFEDNGMEVFAKTIGDTTVSTVEYTYAPEPNGSTIEKRFVYFIRKGPHLQMETDDHTVALHHLADIMAMLSGVGFRPQIIKAHTQYPSIQEYTLISNTK